LGGFASLFYSGSQRLYDSTWDIEGPRSISFVGKPTVANNAIFDATTSSNRVRLFSDSLQTFRWFAGLSSNAASHTDLASWFIRSFLNDPNSPFGGLSRISGPAGNRTGNGNVMQGLRLGKAFDAATFVTGEVADVLIPVSSG
jgi:hypothetical protein